MALLNLEWLIFNRAAQPRDGELGQNEQYFYLYNCAHLQKGCLTTTFKASRLQRNKTLLSTSSTIKIHFSSSAFWTCSTTCSLQNLSLQRRKRYFPLNAIIFQPKLMQSTNGRMVFENFIPKCNYSPKHESRRVFKKEKF